eukprot:6369522-Prymnesium_polylepis.1
MWDEQGWRRRFTGDGVPTATDLLKVIDIISHRLHDPSVPVHPWKQRDRLGDGGDQFSEDNEIAPHYLVRGCCARLRAHTLPHAPLHCHSQRSTCPAHAVTSHAQVRCT